MIKTHALNCHKIRSLDYQYRAEAAEAERRRKCGGYTRLDWKATTGRRRERLKEEAERLALLSEGGGGKDGGGGQDKKNEMNF